MESAGQPRCLPRHHLARAYLRPAVRRNRDAGCACVGASARALLAYRPRASGRAVCVMALEALFNQLRPVSVAPVGLQQYSMMRGEDAENPRRAAEVILCYAARRVPHTK